MNTQTFATRRIAAAVIPALYEQVKSAHEEVLHEYFVEFRHTDMDCQVEEAWGTYSGIEADMSARLGFGLRAEARPEWEAVLAHYYGDC